MLAANGICFNFRFTLFEHQSTQSTKGERALCTSFCAVCLCAHLLWQALRGTGRNITPLITGCTLTSFKYAKTNTGPSRQRKSSMWDWHSCHMFTSGEAVYVSLQGPLCFPESYAPRLLWSIPHPVSGGARTKLLTMMRDINKGFHRLPNFVDGNMYLIFR